MPRQSANSNSYKTTPERNLQRIALISRKNKPPNVSHAGIAAGCGNETKLAYGSSLVKFGAGLSLPGGIVIAIAPTVPFAELLEQQNEEKDNANLQRPQNRRGRLSSTDYDAGALCVSYSHSSKLRGCRPPAIA